MLQMLADMVSCLEIDEQLQTELVRENRELRFEIAHMKLQSEVNNASRKFSRTSTSLPTVTNQVNPSSIIQSPNKVFVQTQISTHISSHVFAYHRKYTLNEVLIK